MSIHSVSIKGKRPQNEDKHDVFVNLNGQHDNDVVNNKEHIKSAKINYYAVYDGHGGKFVSKFLYENMPQFFTNIRVEHPLKKEYISKIYSQFDKVFHEKYLMKTSNTGSTCLVVIHLKKNGVEYLNVLNTGDSRCILCRNNIEFAMSKDHKPNWPEENARIKMLGGDIIFDGYDWRIKDLSVSRAFGDLEAQPYITNMPDIFRYKLTPGDKFFVLACDGLWDVMTNQDVINFILDNCYDVAKNVRINKNVNIAKRLAEFALVKGSCDNITIIIVFLDH